MAKKGNGILVDNRIAELKANIENVDTRAKDEAISIGTQNNWNEELTDKYKDFLMNLDSRFDTSEIQKEIDYLETHFCEDVPDEEAEATNGEYNPYIAGL